MSDEDVSFDSPFSDASEVDPLSCNLSNGHAVKIVAALWSRWRTLEEWASGISPEPYFAIRIYCTENTLPKRMAWVEEYQEGTDFPRRNFEEIWKWLAELCGSREVYQFDDFSEFLDHVSERIIQLSTPESDAVEHLKRLPEISDPEAFDKVDDSVFNDQNDTGNQRGDKIP